MAQDVLRDGFVNLCISSEANWLDGGCRVLVEGQMTDDGTALADTVIAVSGTRDIEDMFGVGSALSETLKVVFCMCDRGISVYALPRSDPAEGTAAVYTLTVAGDATTPGRATLFWGGKREYLIDIPVFEGDKAADIAAAIAQQVPSSFPFKATVAGAVITLTAKNKGTVGNGLQAIYNWANRSNYAPAGVSLEMEQTVVGVGNPVVTKDDYDSQIGECCYSCYIHPSDNAAWQNALISHIAGKWACDKPQCFGHGYTYDRGTLGQVLAKFSNSAEVSRMAICETDTTFPYLKTAAYGALSCCLGCVNPEINIQGTNDGLLYCLVEPESCSSCWTADEVVQLKDNAFVVTGPATNSSGALTNPYVYNDVTNWLYDDLGRVNLTFRDASSRRLSAATAIAFAGKLKEYQSLGFYKGNTTIKEGRKGTNKRMMLADLRKWARDNEGILFSEFDDLDKDLTLVSGAELAKECQGKPNVFYVGLRYKPPIRIDHMNVNMVPELLDNCAR